MFSICLNFHNSLSQKKKKSIIFFALKYVLVLFLKDSTLNVHILDEECT